MTIDALSTALNRRPFEPVRIILSSGDAFDVPHPEMALLVRGGVYVGLPNGSEDDLPEQVVYCSLSHIAAIEQSALN
jgi:hypothetical protein